MAQSEGAAQQPQQFVPRWNRQALPSSMMTATAQAFGCALDELVHHQSGERDRPIEVHGQPGDKIGQDLCITG